MTSASGPEKIVILGGGIGALSTAFELTSQSGWQERFDITIHTLGWRLGGKCASSRGPNGRIEEHGIHGFLGSYYNAMPMMAACYAELGRQPGTPLATFEEAFLPESFALMWEFRDDALRKWPETFPTNDTKPSDGTAFVKLEQVLAAVFEFLDRWTADHKTTTLAEHALLSQARGLIAKASTAVGEGGAVGVSHPLLGLLEEGWRLLGRLILELVEGSDALRHLFIFVDYIVTLVLGFLRDDIVTRGFDSIDDQNWSDWLLSHGANLLTVSSPLALTTINLSYQYPTGDTTLSPRMAAGAYLHWTLKAFAYMGASAWMFAAGTGETIIAPLYLVLRARGVKFEFFRKVEALRLTPDGVAIQSVQLAVQAHLKEPANSYEPLFDVKGLPSWPRRPFYDQLVEGEALRAGDIDLESYWTSWVAPEEITLEFGVDFDRVVFAISIGAIPYLCADLIAARPAWAAMVRAMPTVRTQSLQIWLSKDLYELGWTIPFTGTNTVISCTYITPGNGQVEFRHLIPLEDWPADNTPKSLWYFCGLMSSYGPTPPFTDHDWPNYQWNRVRFQAIQYLQAGMGPLLPKATSNAQTPPGDPMGFDFGLLVDTLSSPIEPDGVANRGIARIESQFWRANIDPSEGYVASPPGSTAHRLKAWDSGFSNLVVAGDWIYTGLNVGSVEGTVMSGKLASYAISGAPALDTIIGYPTPTD